MKSDVRVFMGLALGIALWTAVLIGMSIYFLREDDAANKDDGGSEDPRTRFANRFRDGSLMRFGGGLVILGGIALACSYYLWGLLTLGAAAVVICIAVKS